MRNIFTTVIHGVTNDLIIKHIHQQQNRTTYKRYRQLPTSESCRCVATTLVRSVIGTRTASMDSCAVCAIIVSIVIVVVTIICINITGMLTMTIVINIVGLMLMMLVVMVRTMLLIMMLMV